MSNTQITKNDLYVFSFKYDRPLTDKIRLTKIPMCCRILSNDSACNYRQSMLFYSCTKENKPCPLNKAKTY